MEIELFIEENNFVELCLVLGKREMDCMEWQDRSNLSRVLLSNLDKLLCKNGMGVDKISGYKIMSKVPRKWTTCRIAEITFKTLKIARQNFRSAKSLYGRDLQRNKACNRIDIAISNLGGFGKIIQK